MNNSEEFRQRKVIPEKDDGFVTLTSCLRAGIFPSPCTTINKLKLLSVLQLREVLSWIFTVIWYEKE